MKDDVKVSVTVITYNQSKYIESALKSILKQKTKFKFEIVIGDDGSTDGTQKVIEQALLESVVPVTAIMRQKNIGAIANGADVISKARGEFIAICEGDDYWIDENKLQKQYDAIHRHPNVDLCFHPARIVQKQLDSNNVRNQYAESQTIVPVSVVVEGRGAFMPSNSLLIRTSAILPLPKWFVLYAPVGDSFLQALGATRGGALFLTEPMSAYRELSDGSISSANRSGIKSSKVIESRYQGYISAYSGLKESIPQSDHSSVDRALSLSLFECLVDAIRANDLDNVRNIASAINIRHLQGQYRVCVCHLVRFRFALPLLRSLLFLKRSLN